MFYDDFFKERSIRWTLRALARQRVAVILPEGIWVIERAIGGDEETERNLRTCHIRGWVEPIHDAVPSGELTADARLPLGPVFNGKKTVYRLTDGGWAAINRAHILNLIMLALAFVSVVVAVAAFYFTKLA